MKTKVTDFMLTALLLVIFGFQNCGYEERGHSNTPAAPPGSQIEVGADTTAHPGNIDADDIHLTE